MCKQFTIREKLDLLELTVEIVNTYSERVYLVQQQVNSLLNVVINLGFAQEGYKEILKHLKILQGLIEAKIHKKEGYEAVMQQVTFEY
ncbi:MAG TPA: hypothetical protein VGB63_15335 [Pedobacter sp.]|jgi:hypothetical protein